MNIGKKFLSVIVSLVMVVAMVPMTPALASAEEGKSENESKSSIPKLNDLITKTYYSGYEVDGTEYDLINGLVYTSSKKDLYYDYFYSDGYFAGDPEVYDDHLATMGLNMAAASYGRIDRVKDQIDYTHHPINVLEVMAGAGFTNLYTNDYYQQKPEEDSIGVAIASKEAKINVDGHMQTRKIIVAAMRSGSYESEWASNVTLSTSGEADGFADAADIAKDEIEGYLDTYHLRDAVNRGEAIFWVVGYSRGGATANLTSKRLIDDYQAKGDKVFGYCYEPPQGGMDSAEKPGCNYNWIHNIVNYSDVVPMVAPSSMGFKRYGVDHYVPGYYIDGHFTGYEVSVGNAKYKNSSKITRTTLRDNTPIFVDHGNQAYMERVALMLEQLPECDPGLKFDDSFELAEIQAVKNWIAKEIVPIKKSGNVDLHDYCETLLEKLQEWSITSRNVYAKNLRMNVYDYHSAYSTTFEKACRTLIGLFMGGDSETVDGVKACFNDALDRLSAGDYLNIYETVRNWDIKTENARFACLNKYFWKPMVDRTHEKNLYKYLSDEEMAKFQKAFFSGMDTLLYFVCHDWNTDADDIFVGRGVSSETTVLLGTAIHMRDKLIQPHIETLNLAWLRSYDSFYEDHPTGANDNGTYNVVVQRAVKDKDGFVTYQEETLEYAEGAQVYLPTAEMGNKQFVGWKEGFSFEKAVRAAGLPKGDYDGMACEFTMPDHTVYLKACYEDVELFDTLNISTPENMTRLQGGSKWYDYDWAVSRAYDTFTVKGRGSAGVAVDRLVTVTLDGKKYDLAEGTVSLADYQKYFESESPTNMQLNGKDIIPFEQIQSVSDLDHVGKISNVGRDGNHYVLKFYIPVPFKTLLQAEQPTVRVPEGTEDSKVVALLPQEVKIITDDGAENRSVEWRDHSTELSDGTRQVEGLLDRDSLNADEYTTHAIIEYYPNTTSAVANRIDGYHSFNVELVTTCEGSHVTYYTLDGSDPRSSNTRQVYSGPLAITQTTDVRAVTYAADSDLPGVAVQKRFVVDENPYTVYNVTYHMGQNAINSPLNPPTWDNGMPDTALGAPKRLGYRFEGWFLEESFKTPIETLESANARNIDLYAKWVSDPAYKLDKQITVDLDNWTYNYPACEPQVTGNVDNAPITYYYKLEDQPDSAYTTVKPVDVGWYTVKAVAAETETYKRAEATDFFVILQNSLEVGIVQTEYSYDGRPHTLLWNLAGVDEEDCSIRYYLSEEGIYTPERPYFTEPGTYLFDAEITTRNFFTKRVAEYVVISAGTPDFNLDAHDSVYGDDLDISFSTSSALLDIDIQFKAAGADDSAYTPDLPKNVGNYTVRAIVGDGTRYVQPPPYTANFAITKRPVTISPAPGEGSFYFELSEEEEVHGVCYSGLVDAIDPGAVIGRSSGSDIGSYDYFLKQGPVNGLENYQFTFDDAGLKYTISPMPMSMTTATADYNEATGALSVTVKNGTKALYEGTDYTVEYGYDEDSVYAVLTGMGNYCETSRVGVEMPATLEFAEYSASGLQLMLYREPNASVQRQVTCDGKDMFWLPDENCWALVMSEVPAVRPVFQTLNRPGRMVALPGYEGEKTGPAGDVNCSDTMNIVDAQVAYDMTCNQYQLDALPDLSWLTADVNTDRYLDASDALAIQYASLFGWES